MTTQDKELRELMAALQDLLAFHNGPAGGKRPDVFYKIMQRIEDANPAKFIELLDRIDRLEAENEAIKKEADHWQDEAANMAVTIEAQRKLLEQAACSGIREKFMQEAVERHLLKGTL